MSKRIRQLERGAADLVTIAVGLTIIAITVIGTSYSLLYGRQALVHQEHYRTALYKLRGFMEEEMARIKHSTYYQNDLNWLNQRNTLEAFQLDVPTDRDGRIRETDVRIYRDAIEFVDVVTTSVAPDYLRIVGHAEWREAALAGIGEQDERTDVGPARSIKLQATFLLPG
ncbi:MAG: hypothetical protein IPG71_06115 [bacterium]|nr:hypothetical protein [bacterium]